MTTTMRTTTISRESGSLVGAQRVRAGSGVSAFDTVSGHNTRFPVPPDEPAKITVTHTIVGGQVVWSADAPDPSRDR